MTKKITYVIAVTATKSAAAQSSLRIRYRPTSRP
jgi:hypothetical protein